MSAVYIRVDKKGTQAMEAITENDFIDSEVGETTPKTQIRRLRVEDKTENILTSCCGSHSDKRLVILLSQIGLSVIIIGFSCSMLATTDSESDKVVYTSLLTSIIGFWLGRNDEK